MRYIIALAVLLQFVLESYSSANLFQNAGMEDPDIAGVYGTASGYSMERVTDSHSGEYAMKLSNRTKYWMSLGQFVTLRENTIYNVSAFVKQLNNNTKMWQRFSITAAFQWTEDDTDKDYWELGRHSFGTVESGWFQLYGDFRTPSRSWFSLRVYIQGPDPGIEFLVDDMFLQEVPELTNWKDEAEESIEQIRKTNFTLHVTVEDQFDPGSVELEIKLTNHKFGFGSLVNDKLLLDPEFTAYRNLFYEFFNWATVQSYKWKFNQGTWENPDYNRTVQATNELLKNGLNVRAHCMFWGVPGHSPKEAEQLSGDEFIDVVHERVKFMTNISRGKVEHWDVNNELLHGQLYEELTGDPHFTEEIFRSVNALDPDVKLFLNDYNVVANGGSTNDYVMQAERYKAANCSLYGLGLQGHFHENTEPSPTLIKLRLDKLATTRLPLWITEYTFHAADENTRADWMDEGLTAFFAHPAVEGVIFWGFWDHKMAPDGALVNGNSLHINAAGRRYLDLVKRKWSTHINTSLAANVSTMDLRGFYGDYDVIIRYQGRPIKTQHFSLRNEDDEQEIRLTVDGNGDEVSIPTPRPTSQPVQHVHHVSIDNEETLGHVMSSGDTSEFICTTKYSALSEIGDDKTTDVRCEDEEVMTDCSMITEDGLSNRDGEYITFVGDVPTCRAVNSWKSSAPVQAVARCCRRGGLECTYMKAGPSGHSTGDRTAVACPENTSAVGCSSYGYYGQMAGSVTNLTVCYAQNDGPDEVFVYAACCEAPSMMCEVRKSKPAGLMLGDRTSVRCEPGETLLGCSVFSEDGSTAGVLPDVPDSDTCTTVNAMERYPGQDSVTALAVCCT